VVLKINRSKLGRALASNSILQALIACGLVLAGPILRRSALGQTSSLLAAFEMRQRWAMPARLAQVCAVAVMTYAERGGAPSLATRAMAELLANRGDLPSISLFVGRLASRYETRMAADEIWTRIFERHPAEAEAFRHQVRIISRREGQGAALAAVELRFPESRSNSSRSRIERAQSLDDLGHEQDASAIYEAVAQQSELSWTDLFALGDAYKRRGQLLKAHAFFNRAQAIRPTPAGQDQLDRMAGLEALGVLNDSDVDTYVPARVIDWLVEHAPPPRAQPDGGLLMLNATLGPGGAERQFALTACEVKRRTRLKVEVWCRSFGERAEGDFFNHALKQARIDVREYVTFESKAASSPLSEAVSLLPDPMARHFWQIRNELACLRPSVINIWQEGSIAVAALPALLAGIPRIVLSLRSQPPTEKGQNKPHYRALLQALARNPSVHFTVNSARARTAYAQWLALPEDDLHLVYNGCELAEPNAFPSQPRAAKTPLVGTIMRFDDNKRPLEWLEVARRVRDQRPDTRFAMIGDGPLREAVKARISELALSDSVTLLGTQSDVRRWLQGMSVFLLTSKVEGVPNVVIEAQSCGVPVVATDAGGTREAFAPGHTGVLLNEDDFEENAANAIIQILSQPELRSQMSKAGHAFALQRFSVDRMVNDYLDLVAHHPSGQEH
jgi:glycosyltransferase involved in cell wall biosynthesis